MVQKASEVVGTSTEGFAQAAENAVNTAAKTVRNLRSFRVTVKIYFDLES